MWSSILFLISAIGELYFFLMQRSALEVCRTNDLPGRARFLMLPRYYRLGWLFIAGKWIALIAFVFQGMWLSAIFLVVLTYFISAVVPVPHKLFFEMLYKSLEYKRKDIPEDIREELLDALKSADSQFLVTHRFKS